MIHERNPLASLHLWENDEPLDSVLDFMRHLWKPSRPLPYAPVPR